jgi:cytochrome c peroxidase
MKNHLYILSRSFGIGICLVGILSFSDIFTTPLYLEVPKGWPQPKYDFKKNPLTEESFQLGRHLFYDPILSRDNTISCSSCHLQQTGFTHVDHQLSHGIEGKIGTRNSMAIINLAWNKDFMWDGGVNNLEVQAINPITSPTEMDEKLENVVAKLQNSPKYRTLFTKAYGDDKVTSQRLLKALAQFTVMLKSSNSKYDKVMRKEENFTQQEQRGYDLFKTNCATCHKDPLFADKDVEPIQGNINRLRNIIIYLRSGAQINEQEYARLMRLTQTVGKEPDQIMKDIKEFSLQANDYLNAMTGGVQSINPNNSQRSNAMGASDLGSEYDAWLQSQQGGGQ